MVDGGMAGFFVVPMTILHRAITSWAPAADHAEFNENPDPGDDRALLAASGRAIDYR
jgi:hypothetical protein